MKFTKSIQILMAVLFAGLVSSASAQTYDLFSATRTYVLAPPENLSWYTGSISNGTLDHVKLLGRVKVDFMTITNTGTSGGTLTAQIYTSTDTTNVTPLANYAIITSPTTDTITNWWSYGSVSNANANSVMLPGTLTTSVAATFGFYPPYLAPLPFTNSGAITLNGNKNVEIGFNITDQPRYISVLFTPGGTVTNFSVGAILTGTPAF